MGVGPCHLNPSRESHVPRNGCSLIATTAATVIGRHPAFVGMIAGDFLITLHFIIVFLTYVIRSMPALPHHHHHHSFPRSPSRSSPISNQRTQRYAFGFVLILVEPSFQ